MQNSILLEELIQELAHIEQRQALLEEHASIAYHCAQVYELELIELQQKRQRVEKLITRYAQSVEVYSERLDSGHLSC